ncbi:hypothetical protein [Ramlibacter albus]|uniref:Uncharacterized protein n=1 Tax=Ramlibacter albus TaxID=2079448 RepID=A0A923MAJ6_9BURK|nr:hypothetical protein [Ramlibacter albus]MBC5765789.1 hypothetical protein [Ramlibacter albus]
MPNLQWEMDQLRLADEHIATAERSIAELRSDIEKQQAHGGDSYLGERALHAALGALEEFRRHRELIVDTIQSIKDGRLPST